jgi:hypothetical protein
MIAHTLKATQMTTAIHAAAAEFSVRALVRAMYAKETGIPTHET